MLRLLTLTTMLVAPLCAATLLATSEYGTGTSAFSEWWQAEQRGARLHAERVTLAQRRETMEAITSDLIEGRLSLREASRALYAEMKSRIPDDCPFWEYDPGRSLEESIVRWAVSYLEASLEYNSRRSEILRRLRADLQDYLDAQSHRLTDTIGSPNDQGVSE